MDSVFPFFLFLLSVTPTRLLVVCIFVTLGWSRNRSVGDSKVIRLLSIIHNGIILDLVCGFGGSVGEGVRAGSSLVSKRNLFLFMVEAIA